MKGTLLLNRAVILTILLLTLPLVSCRQSTKPDQGQATTAAALNSTTAAQPPESSAQALPQPRPPQEPTARPAGQDALAVLKKAPKDLTAEDCKNINAWSGQAIKEVMDALNSDKEAAVSSATDVTTIRGACLKNHKVGIPYG